MGWVLGPPDWEQQIYQDRRYQDRHQERHQDRSDRSERTKRSRSKSQSKDSKRKKARPGPTDSDIEKTYTGRDRELAEEFIEQTMEARGGTESEAW